MALHCGLSHATTLPLPRARTRKYTHIQLSVAAAGVDDSRGWPPYGHNLASREDSPPMCASKKLRLPNGRKRPDL